jgi:hypothetical protein
MPSTRRPTVVGLDTLAALLLLLTAAIFSTGGFVFYADSVRVSLRSTHRSLLALFVVVVIRTIVAPRAGPFGRWTSRWQRLLDSIQREPMAVSASPGVWRRAALAALGIAAALGVLLHDQLRHLDRVPDLGDPLFSMWRVGWVAHQIVTDPWHLFDANIFYPERLTLTLSDPVILPALSVAPLRALGVHPAVAYNVLLLSGFWLSGIATYLLVERLTGSARAAFIAGLSYACFGFRFEHYSHLEMQMTEWMPLALLALHLWLGRDSGSARYAIAFALAGVAQLYSSMYYAVFFLVYAAAIAAGLLASHRTPVRPLVRPLLVSAVIAALLAWPLAHAFTGAEPMKGARGLYEVDFYSAAPFDYLRVNRYSALWSPVLPSTLPERTLFPGAAPLALAAVALAPPLGTTRLVYLAGLLVSVDGSFGLHGIAYPFYYQLISPFRGLRSPARFSALVALTLSILAGFGARRLLRRRQSPAYQHAVFAALIAAVMIDAWPSLTLQPVWKEPPPIYDPLRFAPNAVLAETPILEDAFDNIPYMYFSMWHWARMVNGYSGFIPKSYDDLHKAMLRFPDAQGIDALRRRGVTYVSVNCGLNDSERGCEQRAEAMRRNTALRLTADTTWMGRTAQLYEVLPP